MENFDLPCFIARLSDKKEPIFIHGKRVAKLACAIANTMGYSDEEIRIVHHAAVVHDIGKLGLPAEVINKPDVFKRKRLLLSVNIRNWVIPY